MCLQPKEPCNGGWIDPGAVPPTRFIAALMYFAVVSATERDGKLVADLAAKCW